MDIIEPYLILNDIYKVYESGLHVEVIDKVNYNGEVYNVVVMYYTKFAIN